MTNEWLEAAAGAIVDIFQVSDDLIDDEVKNKDSSQDGDRQKRKKFSSVWMIPYLVKHLKFLQVCVVCFWNCFPDFFNLLDFSEPSPP